jgi:hypothetical protein
MFYPTVENKTNIVFTLQRMTILNKGLQCDLYYSPKIWITTLVLEFKNAVSHLHIYEKEFMKYQVVKKVRNLYSKNKLKKNKHTKKHRLEKNTIKQTK